jgi:hypothetical protein
MFLRILPQFGAAGHTPVSLVPEFAGLAFCGSSVFYAIVEARVQGFLEQIKYVDGATVKKDDVLRLAGGQAPGSFNGHIC